MLESCLSVCLQPGLLSPELVVSWLRGLVFRLSEGSLSTGMRLPGELRLFLRCPSVPAAVGQAQAVAVLFVQT